MSGRAVGMANGRIPRGWHFETRADSPTRCRHPEGSVVIAGNVDTLKIWVCRGCREELVPVGPGWRWDRRRRRHISIAAEATTADSGHMAAYMGRA